MEPPAPGHPYRTPVQLAEAIVHNPWSSAVEELDAMAMDVRIMLMNGAFDAESKEAVVATVVSILDACTVLDDRLAGTRAKVGGTAVFALGLGALAARWLPGTPGDVIAAGLLAISTLPTLALGPISRAEGVARRTRGAADELAKYAAARPNDDGADGPTGVRVTAAGAGVGDEAEAPSGRAPASERKGQS